MPETQEIVINTGPMIAIVAALGDLEVLKIYRRVCVPLEVCGEITTGESSCFAALEFEAAHWLEKWKQPLSPAAMLLNTLDIAGLGLGFGIIISSLTTKYRDLRFLVTFGVQLLMYAAPVIYPVSSIPERFQWIILTNPMTPIVEAFRYAFLGAGTVNTGLLLYSFVFMLAVVFLGSIIFNRVEQTFMDTV